MNYIAIIIYGIDNFFDSSSKFIYDYFISILFTRLFFYEFLDNTFSIMKIS